MAADKDYLRQLAIAIRDEYRKGANTAYRVGSLLLSLIDTDANIESLSQYFIRKDKEDVAKEIITFLKGLVSNLVQSEGFSPGEFGSGFILRNDDGGSYLEIDRLLVRRIAYFVELVIKSLKHVGGSLVLSPASMVCSKVEEYDAYYRCYFEHEREGRFIYQEFVPGDQARAQEFNVKEGVNQNVASRFYWRLVIAVGDNYIDLSKSDAAVGSVAPQAGDDIVLLGNRDDVTRQNAIILSTIGDDAPSIKQYKGINSYSTEGKEITIISSVLNSFTGRFRSSVTGKDFDAMLDEFNTDLSKIKAQTDQEYTIWFYEYEPTLDNLPASDWNEGDKADHEYDIFYYSEAGLAWRFMLQKDGSYAWVPITDQQTLRALEKAAKAQQTADKVTADLNEIVSDGILSMLEKKEVLKEWQSIAAEYVQNLSTAAGFDMTGDKAFISYKSAFSSLGNYMNGGSGWDGESTPAWLADLTTNQPIDADAYRDAWMSYYNAERVLLNRISAIAKEKADDARTEADKANRDLATIVADGILSNLEKKEVLKEWQSIESEYAQNVFNARKYEVDTTDYTDAYFALGTYMNGGDEWDEGIPAWLSDLTTNQEIDSETYRSKWVDYYNEEIALLDAISKAIKDKADKAQQTADKKRRNFVSQPVPPYDEGDTWSNATYGTVYTNDYLVCIRSKAKGESFSIDDWEPSSDMNSATKKIFESLIEQLDNRITLQVTAHDELKETVTALGIRMDGAEEQITIYANKTNTLEGTVTQLGIDLDAAEEQISIYATKVGTLEGTVTQLGIDLDAAEEQISIYATKVGTLEGTVTQLGIDLDAAEGSISAIAGLFDKDGHLIEGSGWVTTTEYNSLYSVVQDIDGALSAKAEVRTSVQYDPNTGAVTSAIKLTADKISLEGATTINNSFSVGTDGTTRIAGFTVSGNGLINSGFDNDAYVIFRNDTHKTFAGIGGNVLPSATGLRAVARFENHDTEDFWYMGANYAMLVSAQGGRENVAIQLNGGSVACLALKTQIIGHDNIVQSTAPTSKSVTLGRDVGSLYVSTQFNWKSSSSATSYESKARDIYLTLPTMDVYDDGHTIKIKRGSNNSKWVYISPGGSYRMVYNSSIGSYVRTYGTTYIMYDGASYATTSDKLGIESEGDAMELVYHRDLQITINNITYYGCWIQHKHPRSW